MQKLFFIFLFAFNNYLSFSQTPFYPPTGMTMMDEDSVYSDYYKSGTIHYKLYFNHTGLDSVELFNLKGEKINYGNFTRGNGEINIKEENGSSSFTYISGKMVKLISYYDNNWKKKSIEMNFEESTSTTYYENGNIKDLHTHNESSKSEQWNTYYSNGALEYEEITSDYDKTYCMRSSKSYDKKGKIESERDPFKIKKKDINWK